MTLRKVAVGRSSRSLLLLCVPCQGALLSLVEIQAGKLSLQPEALGADQEVLFVLLPGQRHDTIGVPPLIEGVAFGALLGDKAFDMDWLRADLDARGAIAVIPPKVNRKAQLNLDRDMYRWRHLIENTFAKLKEFRAVATRYDKTDTSYTATIQLAAAIIASR